MKHLSRGLLAAACATAFLAVPTAAIADTATVRIEGDTVRLDRTVGVLSSGTFGPGNCPNDTPGGAIDVAVEQNWDRVAKGWTETILDETHDFTNDSDSWEFWINGKGSNVGLCDTSQPLNDGDQVLVFSQRSPGGVGVRQPLFITEAPSAVERGKPATFTVVQRSFNYPNTTEAPASDVTVSGGGASATTDAQGRATLTFPSAGTASVTATGTNRVPSDDASVAVTEPGQAAPASTSSPFVADRLAPKAFLGNARTRTYSRRNAPRVLKGHVDDNGGVRMVKLRLTRTAPSGRCFAFSGKRERFIRRPKCGASSGWWFAIGDDADWEYQLPKKLGPGRYVLDVNAIDKSYNRDDERRRGENRAVFVVR